MLEQVFSFVCGQNPAHTWTPGGELLPCCQRCTGLYAGAAAALLLQAALRIRPGARFLQLHGLLLLMMVPLGLHWLAHGALVRTVSGLLFGFGIVSFLWLLPGKPRWGGRPQTRRPQLLYAAGMAASLLIVPALAAWGGRGGALALTMAAGIGLLGLGLLVAANIGVGLAWLVACRTRSPLHPAR